jgi:IPT/TIG domain-containing protein
MGNPHLSSIDPQSGPSQGNSKVDIRGSDLQFTQRVMFNDAEATEVKPIDHDHVTCKAPAGTVGAAKVTTYDDQGLPSDNTLDYVYVK